MRKFLLTLAVMLTACTFASADTYEYSWAVTSSDKVSQTASFTQTYGGVSWTVDAESNGSGYFAQRNGTTSLLFGSKANSEKSVKFSATAPFSGKLIKSVSVKAFNGSSSSNTVVIQLNGVDVASAQELSQVSATYSFEDINKVLGEDEALSIYFSNSNTSNVSGNTLNVSAITIEYEDAPTGPVDFAYAWPDAPLTLEVNDVFDLKLPTDRPEITWATTDDAIALVEDGEILAKGVGNATISASWMDSEKFNAGSASFEVVVKAPKVAVEAEWLYETLDLNLGEIGENLFAINTEGVSISDFIFTSSNEKVATFTVEDDIFTITSKAAGTATITATLGENDNYFLEAPLSFTVKVIDPNAPDAYELVNDVAGLEIGAYYVFAAKIDDVYYSMGLPSDDGNYMQSAVVAYSDGKIAPAENTIVLKLLAGSENKYVFEAVNGEGYLYATGNTSIATAATLKSEKVDYSISFTGDFVAVTSTNSRQIAARMSNNQVSFRYYAASNLTTAGYYRVSLYRTDYVPAAAPVMTGHDGASEGDEVTFAPVHSSHSLEYCEYSVLAEEPAAMKAPAEAEWTALAAGESHVHTVRALAENEAEYRLEVRAKDAKGNYSAPVVFAYNGTTGGDVTGIEAIEAEAGAVEYFNLQGVRVDGQLTPGVYIRRAGSKVAKVLVR